MHWPTVALSLLGVLCASPAAQAADCPGNPDAIGTSRVISIDPAEHPRIGTMQYVETLPLADKEIVLTFDDGPLPPHSSAILDILASECVRATYFIVGRMARTYPDELHRIRAEGHIIGTRTQNHPLTLDRMTINQVQNEIDNGIASSINALGNVNAVAPFFRISSLARPTPIEAYLRSRGLMLWSADFVADDGKRIEPSEFVERALRRIEAKGKGILVLHDNRPVTVQALPLLLSTLKERGYRIVHVVPAGPDNPKTATAPQDWTLVPVHQGASQTPPRAGSNAAGQQTGTISTIVPARTGKGKDQPSTDQPRAPFQLLPQLMPPVGPAN